MGCGSFSHVPLLAELVSGGGGFYYKHGAPDGAWPSRQQSTLAGLKDHAPGGGPLSASRVSATHPNPAWRPKAPRLWPLFLQPRTGPSCGPAGSFAGYSRVTQRIVSWGRSRDGSEFARGNRSVDTEGFCKSQMTLNSGLRWQRATLGRFGWNGRNSVPEQEVTATLRPP